jgi:hypothetical protein
MLNSRFALLAASSLFAFPAIPAQAAIVTYIGADDSVSSLAQMTNSSAAAAAFDAATTGASLVDFESALPAGFSFAGGSITNNSGCGALCGFNPTLGGENFQLLVGGSVTFTFTDPISAFGFYISGLQTDIVAQQTLTFSDGSTQVIDTPSAINGGGAFIGFTDFGKSIVSLTYNATSDIVAIDDIRFFAGPAVPEPATWAMMIAGFGAVGFAMRRRRNVTVSFA